MIDPVGAVTTVSQIRAPKPQFVGNPWRVCHGRTGRKMYATKFSLEDHTKQER
jgi:hypothetical protein